MTRVYEYEMSSSNQNIYSPPLVNEATLMSLISAHDTNGQQLLYMEYQGKNVVKLPLEVGLYL